MKLEEFEALEKATRPGCNGPDTLIYGQYLDACRAMVPKLLKLWSAVERKHSAKHRENDHSIGCPACDAERDEIEALCNLDAP